MTKRQKKIIEYIVANPGLTDTQIANDMGITTVWMCNLRKKPEFSAALDEAMNKQWAGWRKDAQNKMKELLNCGKPEIEYKAAEFILKTNGVNAVEKVDLNADVNTIKVNVIDDKSRIK